MRKLLLFVLLAFAFMGSAQAHRIFREIGYQSEEMVPYEIIVLHIDVKPEDVGRPGAVFVGVVNRDGGILMLTDDGWQSFSGGLGQPVAAFESIPSTWSITLFHSRGTMFQPFQEHLDSNYGMRGRTLCDGARYFATDEFALGVGYGIVSEEGEATLERAQALGIDIDPNHVRLTYAISDMTTNTKWQEMLQLRCSDNPPFGYAVVGPSGQEQSW